MSYLKRRVQKIEDKLNICKEPNPQIIIIDADEASLGPVKEWLTFQEQLQREGPNSQVMLFIASAEAEIEARQSAGA